MALQVALMVTKELQMAGLEVLVRPEITQVAVVVVTREAVVADCKRVAVVTHKLEAVAGLTRLSALLHRASRIPGTGILQLV